MATKIGIIGGSGLYDLDVEQRREIDCETRWGPTSARVIAGCLNGAEILFLPRHGTDHHIPPHLINYRANLAALCELGADAVVGVTAVGGISADAITGSLIVPDQIIDYTYGRAHTIYDGTDDQVDHIEFAEPYSPPSAWLAL